MITSRQQRILRQARNAIATGQVRFICYALKHIADSDHRRAVQDDCIALANRFRAGLGEANTLGEYMVQQGLPLNVDTATQARLAWIDRTLET